MSHQHWCGYTGHYWDCPGAAVRLFQAQPTVCMCLQHGVPMEEGDHSACSMELLSCPEHRADHMRAMGYAPDYVIEEEPDQESSMFTDADGNPTVGFCLWCGRDFYTFEEHEAHIADNAAACPVFQKMKDNYSTPPGLQAMLDEADNTGQGEKDDEE